MFFEDSRYQEYGESFEPTANEIKEYKFVLEYDVASDKYLRPFSGEGCDNIMAHGWRSGVKEEIFVYRYSSPNEDLSFLAKSPDNPDKTSSITWSLDLKNTTTSVDSFTITVNSLEWKGSRVKWTVTGENQYNVFTYNVKPGFENQVAKMKGAKCLIIKAEFTHVELSSAVGIVEDACKIMKTRKNPWKYSQLIPIPQDTGSNKEKTNSIFRLEVNLIGTLRLIARIA